MSNSDVVYDEATGLPQVGEDEFWELGKNWIEDWESDGYAYSSYIYPERIDLPGIRLDLKQGIYTEKSGGWWRAPERVLKRKITLYHSSNDRVNNPTVEDIRKLAENVMAQVANAEREKALKADREKYFGTYPPKKLG